VQISLVEAGKSLLSNFDKGLGEYTLSLFKRRNIDVRTGLSVKAVMKDALLLSDGSNLDFGLVVWSTGVAASHLVNSLPFLKDRSGRIQVDEYLRVKGFENSACPLDGIYALGDCSTFSKEPLAQTAQAAEQEGKYLAKTLNNMASGKKIKPFHYNFMGMFTYVGGKKALFESPQLGRMSGFISWILWNAAYITKLVSVRNKIMIPLYWFKSFVFGRDISRF